MWASLPASLITLLLFSTEAEAWTNRFHRKHGTQRRPGRHGSDHSREDANATVVVTLTVQPMPIGTYDGILYPGPSTSFPTATDVESGIFPPGPTEGGVIGTGTGTGIFPPGATGGRTGVIGTGTGIIFPTGGTGSFPVFTGAPSISIPSGPDESTFLPTTTPDESSLPASSASFPVFTESPVIDIPGASSAPEVAPTTAANGVSTPASLSFPLFTGTPIIEIPSGTEEPTVAPSTTTQETSEIPGTSSIPGTPNSFPVFTGTPIINIPGASAQSATVASTSTPSPVADITTPFLRGVNLGGWLVLEKWMTEDLFTGAFASAKDQYTFDSLPGSAEALEQHWSTFFTEADINTLASAGINALRIPIGYWSYDNAGTPYHAGADAFLEQSIQWARNHGMKVLVDLHGSPGSQNGFDNSGRAGEAHWQEGGNLEKSIQVLKVMAKKYGAEQFADVVVGLQMVNEPISWGNNDFTVTKSWSEKAYAAVKAEAENQNLMIVMHDAFQGGVAWEGVSTALRTAAADTAVAAADSNPFTVDEHLYQLFTDAHNSLNQDQHIAAACAWSSSLSASSSLQKTIVGEFSAATNICLLTDGTTIPGTSCSEEGCECQSGDWTKWSQGMKDQMRKYVEAQLDVFEANSVGYFAWSAKAPGGWGVLNMLGNGVWPASAEERKFPNQCGGVVREVTERVMRRGLRR